MVDHNIADKKSILADPIAAYSSRHTTPSPQKIAALERLWNEYVDTKQQYKSTQDQCKKLSRLIGAAKRNNEQIDDLIVDMQSHTADAKSLDKQLETISQKIISHFDNNIIEKNDEELVYFTPVRHATPDTAFSSEKLIIKQLSDEHAAWNGYVESNAYASIYHRSEWQTIIKHVFGHRSFYLLAQDSDQNIVGILPLIRLTSRLFGDFMVSMPYFNYGGALADSPVIENRLIETAINLAQESGVSHIEFRDDIAREGLVAKTEKVNMILALPDDHERLWSGFSSKLRSQIRRAQRESAYTRTGGMELLNDFYTVFARNMRDLGTPVYNKRFFQSILQHFSEQARIIVVYLNNRPVAAAFLLGNKGTLEIPWASTIKEVNRLSMNMLLYWEVLKFAIDEQYRYFDFGRSSRDSGTFRFKQQWGAKPRQSYWHYWLREGFELPSLNPSNPKYSLLISAWKMLPVSVSKIIGPFIVKNIP